MRGVGEGGGGGRRGGQEWSGIPILVPAVLRLEYSRLPRLLLIGWLPAWLFPSGLALGITGIPSVVFRPFAWGPFSSSLIGQLWWVGAPALRDKWAEYITRIHFIAYQQQRRSPVLK